MKKPYLFLFAGIILLAVTGLVYKALQEEKSREAISIPAPLPPAVVIKAKPITAQGKISEISLVVFPQKENTSLSAISFAASLSVDATEGLIPTAAKITVDNSFKSAGWQLIHNKVTAGDGKILMEIAAVPVGRKFVLEREQVLGKIAIKPISDSSVLSVRLDPQATKILAGDAVTALRVISGN